MLGVSRAISAEAWRPDPGPHGCALMERLAITDALSLDNDFRIYRYGPQRRRAFTVHP